MSGFFEGLGPLLNLRWNHLQRRTRRKIGNLRPYLDWQAVVIYLYAGAVFLGGPLYYLLFPSHMPDAVRQVGGPLLILLGLALLFWTGYHAIFGAVDAFPAPLPLGDISFVLTAPVSRGAFLLDRLLWGILQAMGESALLFPAIWIVGRAFLPPWGPWEALVCSFLYLVMRVGVLGTGLFLHGLPRFVRTGLRGLRMAMWGLGALVGLAGFAVSRLTSVAGAAFDPASSMSRFFGPESALSSLGEAPALSAIDPASISTAVDSASGLASLSEAFTTALPLSHLVAALLPVATLWAVVAAGLTLLLARPSGEDLAEDTLRAERRRIAHLSSGAATPDGRGLFRTSLRGWWGRGMWAVAWRQVASYRHLPLSTWPPRLFALLTVIGAPYFLVVFGPQVKGVAGGMPLLVPAMIGVSAAASMLTAWRHEVREGVTRRLLPLSTQELILGFAFWPTVVNAAAAGVGLLIAGQTAGWGLFHGLAALPLALAAALLVTILALLEEQMAESSLTGPAQGLQTAKTASLILAGIPIAIATFALAEFGWTVGLLISALLVAVEAWLLVHYLSLRLSDRPR